MKQWVVELAKDHFHRSIDVCFYDHADASGAHAHQGGTHQIAFNLRGGYLQIFHDLQAAAQAKSQPEMLKKTMQLLAVVSHELTHTEEELGESTHGVKFFREQRKKLEGLLRISDRHLFGKLGEAS